MHLNLKYIELMEEGLFRAYSSWRRLESSVQAMPTTPSVNSCSKT